MHSHSPARCAQRGQEDKRLPGLSGRTTLPENGGQTAYVHADKRDDLNRRRTCPPRRTGKGRALPRRRPRLYQTSSLTASLCRSGHARPGSVLDLRRCTLLSKAELRDSARTPARPLRAAPRRAAPCRSALLRPHARTPARPSALLRSAPLCSARTPARPAPPLRALYAFKGRAARAPCLQRTRCRVML